MYIDVDNLLTYNVHNLPIKNCDLNPNISLHAGWNMTLKLLY